MLIRGFEIRRLNRFSRSLHIVDGIASRIVGISVACGINFSGCRFATTTIRFDQCYFLSLTLLTTPLQCETPLEH